MKTQASEMRRASRTDGAATRVRILEAAGELFAASGYAETTGKAVAVAAGVDLASINYHFGSRNGLYQAVLIEAHHRLISLSDLQQLAGSRLAPAAKLGVLIEQFVERATSRSRGWHLHVLARELLAPSSHLRVLLRDELQPKLSVIKQVLSEITGIPLQDAALVRCLVSVAAPCMMLLVAGRGVPGPAQDVLRMPRQVLVAHLQSFALAGLKAVGREYAKRTAG